MKILVDEMPLCPPDCIFSESEWSTKKMKYDYYCRLYRDSMLRCASVSECPYLKVLEEKEDA